MREIRVEEQFPNSALLKVLEIGGRDVKETSFEKYR